MDDSGEWTLLIDGVNFGEGPRWHDGELWYSDFYQHAVYRVAADGTRTTVVELPNGERPSGLGWLPDGDLLIVAMLSKRVLRFDGSSLTVHAELGDFAADKCNDMVVDANGNAYVGHFGFDLEAGADFAPASLLLVRPDGTVEVAAPDLAFPNGTVITPDGSTLIVGQSAGADYLAFDIAADGTLSNRRVWASVPGTAPDGCTLDAAGGIWFSDARGRRVMRVLEGGEVTHEIATPTKTFACMLGGSDGATLHVLCADGAGPAEAGGDPTGVIVTTRVAHPRAGRP